MREEALLEAVRAVVREAVAERRGLVVFTRLAGSELDRMARETERRALDRVAQMVPETSRLPLLREVAELLSAMRQELDHLDRNPHIRPSSRALAQDEVVWQTFERVASLMGVDVSPRS